MKALLLALVLAPVPGSIVVSQPTDEDCSKTCIIETYHAPDGTTNNIHIRSSSPVTIWQTQDKP